MVGEEWRIRVRGNNKGMDQLKNEKTRGCFF